MTVEWQGILRRFVLGWGYTMKHNIGENGIKERVMWWLNIPIGCLRPDKNGRWTFETSCYKGHYLSAPTPLFIHPCLRARVIFIWMIYCITNMAYNTDYKVYVNISLIYCWKWNTWSLTLNEFHKGTWQSKTSPNAAIYSFCGSSLSHKVKFLDFGRIR